MEFLKGLLTSGSGAAALAMLSLTVTVGLLLGSIRIFGVRLGVSAVLFSAIFFGQLGLTIEPAALSFLRDFSLIIFVYAIGLQLGPGFIATLRESGAKLNLLAIAVVSSAAVLSAVIVLIFPGPRISATGLYTGAMTSTTGLASGEEALRILLGKESPQALAATDAASLAYTVTYPFGLVGPIIVIVLLQKMFRIRLADERAALAATEAINRPPVETMDIRITRNDLTGKPLRSLTFLRQHTIILSRLMHDGQLSVPNGDTTLEIGDLVRAVGPRPALMELLERMGQPANVDLGVPSGDVDRMELVVTRVNVVGKSLKELNIGQHLGVTIARVSRGGVSLVPTGNLKFLFGDDVIAVGHRHGLKALEAEMGNSQEDLNRPQLIPLFIGIVLGVAVGSIPFHVPGLKTDLRIGLAAGPMIVALMLARLGRVSHIVWYMPAATNQLMRDFGLAVFLACVGIQAGDHFVQKVLQGGLPLVVWGAVVTMLPMLIVGIVARLVFKMNFITLTGLVAGAMTNATTLVFANEHTESSAPSVAYAAVYPLAMIVPIVSAQILATAVR